MEEVMIDWHHSAAVHMAENNRHLYNVQRQLLHAHLGEYYTWSFTVKVKLVDFS